MNELIKIETYDINGNVNAVNARDLYEYLEIKRDFSNWVKDQLIDFIEDKDYSLNLANRSDGLPGKPRKEYILTLDIAKHIAMIQRNTKGHEIRNYFIEYEKKGQQKYQIKDLINQKYNRLTIIGEAKPYISPRGKKYRKVLCQCECGNYKEIRLGGLRSGNTKSCGCLQKENLNKLKHGYSKRNKRHPLYSVWANMKARCYNSNRKRYKDWGGRNIKVCNEWINDPEIFITWALKNGWKKKLLIDRINNDGDYESNNCRFIDAGLSNRNTRLLRLDNISGYRGVSWDKVNKKWRVSISINNKHKHLGYFNSPKLAALHYDVEVFLLNDNRPMNFIERI